MIRNFIELFYRTYKYSFYNMLSKRSMMKSYGYIKDETKTNVWRKYINKACLYTEKCLVEQRKIDELQQYFRERIKGLI